MKTTNVVLDYLNKIEKDISDGVELNIIFSQLSTLFQGEDNYSDLLLLASREAELRKEIRRGTINNAERKIEKAQIRYALIDYIDMTKTNLPELVTEKLVIRVEEISKEQNTNILTNAPVKTAKHIPEIEPDKWSESPNNSFNIFKKLFK